MKTNKQMISKHYIFLMLGIVGLLVIFAFIIPKYITPKRQYEEAKDNDMQNRYDSPQ